MWNWGKSPVPLLLLWHFFLFLFLYPPQRLDKNTSYTVSGKMETGAACSCSSAARSDLMGGSVSDIPNIFTAQNRSRNNRQSLSQDPGEHLGVSPCSHQPWWSVEFLKGVPSPIITVRKSKKQPQPPQRSTSLTQPTSKPRPILKRYSCPPIGIGHSTSRLYSHSSSSSSSTSSCSSPPPVPTSLITGPDPLGWKLRPKSRSRHVSRLSLQIPLPVIAPDPSARPSANSQHTQNSKPTVKPFRRRHSDSSALLTSLATQNPAVTLEALRALHLRPVTVPYENDDVFREVKGGGGGKVKQSKQPRKIPPPVPKKTLMARRKAKMIALSQRSAKANEEHIYACVIKPKQLGQTELKEDETHTGKITPVKIQ